MKLSKDFIFCALLFILSLLVFMFGLGKVHLFDWDEINFAESAREMIVSGDYLTVQVNFKPFWEKPPLFIWIQAFSMKIFGINEFAARFPNALLGAINLVVIFLIGKKLKDRKFGYFWVLSFVGSLLPFFYSKSGIIDPFFNFFIFLGIYFFIKYQNDQSKNISSIVSGVFIGLSVLTKGPVGLLIFLLSVGVYSIIKKFKIYFKIKHALLFFVSFGFIGGFWFILQILNGNYDIIVDFVNYQIELFSKKVAGHGGFLLYHFVVLFFGVFPASIIALRSFLKFEENDKILIDFSIWMKILFWVVLILFTIVKTKIVHYSSMCYYPISFLSAFVLYKIYKKEIKLNVVYKILITINGLLLAIFAFVLPIIEKNKEYFKRFVHDEFTLNNLNANVDWGIGAYLSGVLMLLGIVILLFSNISEFKKYTGFFVLTLIFTFLSMIFIVPNIEKYSQGAVIEFYESKAHEDCYIETIGFKTYADLFYSNKQKQQNENSYDKNWLLTGKVDKKTYFVAKINKLEYIKDNYPKLKILYMKNGFVFYSR